TPGQVIRRRRGDSCLEISAAPSLVGNLFMQPYRMLVGGRKLNYTASEAIAPWQHNFGIIMDFSAFIGHGYLLIGGLILVGGGLLIVSVIVNLRVAHSVLRDERHQE